jgi:hypothetical protein
MTQEEFMDVLAMKRAGMTFTEIAVETGYHPATISKWCRDGGPPAARTVDVGVRVIDPRWADRLTALLGGNKSLLATSLFEIIRAEGRRQLPVRMRGQHPDGVGVRPDGAPKPVGHR